MASVLGWAFYVASLGLAIGYAALFILVSIVAAGTDPIATPGNLVALIVPPLVVSGLGRDMLYWLAGT
jgi:hypothetical protein